MQHYLYHPAQKNMPTWSYMQDTHIDKQISRKNSTNMYIKKWQIQNSITKKTYGNTSAISHDKSWCIYIYTRSKPSNSIANMLTAMLTRCEATGIPCSAWGPGAGAAAASKSQGLRKGMISQDLSEIISLVRSPTAWSGSTPVTEKKHIRGKQLQVIVILLGEIRKMSVKPPSSQPCYKSSDSSLHLPIDSIH